MSKLLLATNNPGKVREILAITREWGLEILTPAQIDLHLEIEESGHTYAENAAMKARAFARAARLLSMADDSGLEVDALDGKPGLHSARYSPLPHASDADRRAYLLEQLHGRPRPWTARFRCIIAISAPDGETRFAEGVCPGEIIPEERGDNGFGYDPIFLLPDSGLTMAQLSIPEKNQLSHRARAVRAAYAVVMEFLKN
jgi:XTP/dITP diphosphohydrolase